MKIGAFFDLDGTIVKGVSAIRFSRFLVRRKILQPRLSVIPSIMKLFYDYLNKKNPDYIDEADDVLALSMKGLNKSIIEEQANQYAGLELNNVITKSMKLINEHKRKKHMLFLLSVSPDELVKKIGDLLGFDESIGTRLSVKRGVYTGKITTPSLIGTHRVKIVKRLARKYNISLGDSFAYGDSLNDVPVLESVGNPHPLNADKMLKSVAKRENWKVL